MKLQLLFLIALLHKCYSEKCETQQRGIWRQDNSYVFYDWQKIFVCKNVELQQDFEIPNESDVKWIIFQDSTITYIPNHAFKKFGDLENLFLNNTGVAEIKINSFQGLTNLQTLYLRQNKIKTIPYGTFNNVPTLRLLDLSINKIESIEDISVSSLNKLEELILSYNGISSVNEQTLASLHKLRSLDLAHNKLSNIDANAFKSNNFLERLLVNDNILENFPKNVFQNTAKLRILDISENHMLALDFNVLPQFLGELYANNIKMDSVVDLTRNAIARIDIENNNISYISGIRWGIVKLYLRNNSIPSLNDLMFQYSTDVTSLDLSYNLINNISEHAFKNLRKLRTLDLSYNNIKYLPVGLFKNQFSLYLLKLSSNNIERIDEFGTFTGLDNLLDLYLDNNNLMNIHEKTLYVLKNLRSLFLQNNLLMTFNTPELVTYVPHLIAIELDHNSWNCDSLLETVTTLAKNKITIYNGTVFDTENINGIACYNPDKIPVAPKHSSKELPAFLQVNPSQTYVKPKPTNLSQDDLLNSVVSNLFNCTRLSNILFRGFRNTSFYKYLEHDFLNSSFVRYFNSEYKQSSSISKPYTFPIEDFKTTVKNTEVTETTHTTEIVTVISTPITHKDTTTKSENSLTSTTCPWYKLCKEN